MKLMVLLSFLTLAFTTVRASHIVGGEMYYDRVSPGVYRFNIIIYRDCYSTGAPYDNPMILGVFNSSGTLLQTVEVDLPPVTVLPVVFNNPCVNPPGGTCTQRAIYQKTINLPPINGGYRVSYERCCRGPNVSNLVVPEDTGLTLMAIIPGTETGAVINSSPRFTNYPPLIICRNDNLIFDHSATDPDGDVLRYSLVTPYHGASSTAPGPNIPPPPPYPFVTWAGGHNAAIPLGPNSATSIDPVTGVLQCQPSLTGLYVVGIQVEERRNGVVISRTIRDFLFRVINCDISLQALLPLQTQLSTFNGYCDGLTVKFENNSYGGSTYFWDFGVSGTNADTSNAFAPTYTYPNPGTYTAMLIIDRGNSCTDTAYMVVEVNNPFHVNFNVNDSTCFIGHSLNFQGLIPANSPPTTFQWDFGSSASQGSATSQNVNGITFGSPGTYPVYFQADNGACKADTTIDVVIYPPPSVDFTLPLDYQCTGLNVQFFEQTTNSVIFQWDFGDPTTTTDVSTAPNPTYFYANPGFYTAQLIAGSGGLCMDTVTHQIEVYPDMVLDFFNDDSLCIVDNSFDFVGNFSGPPNAVYSWDFGAFANPLTSTDTSVYGVVFSKPGNHLITLSGFYLDCEHNFTKQIFIYKEPTIDFSLDPGNQCAPFLAQFHSLASADSPIYYDWNFSNGTTSNSANPSVLFTNPGVFPIHHTIRTDRGCIDTLQLTKANIVDVKPVPTSGFSVDKSVVDICHSTVVLFDESIDADFISYFPGENNIYSYKAPQEFGYAYQTSGNKTIIQIAENNYGCTDTSSTKIYVDPFVLYIPNAFTPDGDQFNNTFQAESYLQAEEFHLIIYNRWGEKVFESFDQKASWDGTYKGKLQPDGLYAYTLRLVSCGPEDKYQNIQGHIFLLK